MMKIMKLFCIVIFFNLHHSGTQFFLGNVDTF
jgi:hypothetical protein